MKNYRENDDSLEGFLLSNQKSLACLYRLVLDRNTYRWVHQQPLQIQGEIQAEAGRAGSIVTLERATLSVMMRNPQTGSVIEALSQSFELKALPQPFTVSINFEKPLNAPLLLGEMSLSTDTGENLSSYHFSLFCKETQSDGEKIFQDELSSLTAESLADSHTGDASEAIAPVPIDSPIAPKLFDMEPSEKSVQDIDVPEFLASSTDIINPRQIQALLSSISGSRGEMINEDNEGISQEEGADIEGQPEPSSIELDWSSRFFRRLNALAHTEEEESDGVISEVNRLSRTASLADTPTQEIGVPSTERASNQGQPLYIKRKERVIQTSLAKERGEMAAPIETLESTSHSALPKPNKRLSETILRPFRRIPSEIPLPEIALDRTDYKIDDIALIQVRLPKGGDRYCIQLRVLCGQSQTLLFGPYQLIDFELDDQDCPSWRLTVKMPARGTTLRIEAIAYEPYSRKESGVVALDYQVLPSDTSAE